MSLPSISALTAGISFSACDAGLHEEAHEAELHAVLLLEQLLVLVAQRHDRAHVDLVEGRQHGGGVLRLLQAARDGLAQPRHAARAPRARHRRRGDGARICTAAVGDRRRRRGGALDRRQHVALGDAAVLAGAVDLARRRRRSRPRSCAPTAAAACAARRPRARRRGCRLRRFGRLGGGAGAGGGGFGAARRRRRPSIWPSSAPTATVSPSLAAISPSTPAAGAGTSSVTLSVSSSTSGSSTATASPGFLNHLPTVASVTDSPRVGTRMSVAMPICPVVLVGDRARVS